jgi:squalene synthase HpnC
VHDKLPSMKIATVQASSMRRATSALTNPPCNNHAACLGMLRSMSVDHYENFPVASLLLPRRLRAAVGTVYAFARSADDLADEGDAAPTERLAALDAYRHQLDRIEQGETPDAPLFTRLAALVRSGQVALSPLRDLLSAFSQDVSTTRYADFPALLDYCRRSANPVGRIMLGLYGFAADAQALRQSDQICTALQLINFWQDVAIDLAKDRIYLPLDDLARFGISAADLQAVPGGPAWGALMAFEVERARAMMLAGAPLALALPGRIGFELRLVVQGGLRILEKIEAAGFDVFEHRPVLTRWDWPRLLLRALRARSQAALTISP